MRFKNAVVSIWSNCFCSLFLLLKCSYFRLWWLFSQLYNKSSTQT